MDAYARACIVLHENPEYNNGMLPGGSRSPAMMLGSKFMQTTLNLKAGTVGNLLVVGNMFWDQTLMLKFQLRLLIPHKRRSNAGIFTPVAACDQKAAFPTYQAVYLGIPEPI
jgi:hypothetical protein